VFGGSDIVAAEVNADRTLQRFGATDGQNRSARSVHQAAEAIMDSLRFDMEDVGGMSIDADDSDLTCDDIRVAWLASTLKAERAALASGFDAIWLDR
jgi:hypothetical protein